MACTWSEQRGVETRIDRVGSCLLTADHAAISKPSGAAARLHSPSPSSPGRAPPLAGGLSSNLSRVWWNPGRYRTGYLLSASRALSPDELTVQVKAAAPHGPPPGGEQRTSKCAVGSFNLRWLTHDSGLVPWSDGTRTPIPTVRG